MDRESSHVTLRRMRARRTAHLVWARVLVGALAAASGCGSDGGSGSCPRDLPAACPDPAPSYANQVGAIVQTYCVGCHAPAGVEPTLPFETVADIQYMDRFARMLIQVQQCKMPMAGYPQPTEQERVALLGWLVCAAPDN
jgi:hypothetical protein